MHRRHLLSMLAGPAAFVLLLGTWSLAPGHLRDVLRERAFDLLLPLVLVPDTAEPGVAIVDIDRATLAQLGPWPWPRARLARLIAATAAAQPAALAVDILFTGPDRFSTAALLEAMASEGRVADITASLPELPDGDALLAEALAAAPAVLGFALESDAAGQDLPATPILTSGPVSLPGLWRSTGVTGPLPAVAAGAHGFGALVASADTDGPIRRVPLLVLAGSTLRPGLAVEAVRLAQDAAALLIGAGRLQIGMLSVPLGSDAELRLVQRPPGAWSRRTVSAARLLDDPVSAGMLAGRIVLIGSSAPELGGLRVTPASPATPSVQIEAEAIDAMLRGSVASRPAGLGTAEFAAAVTFGLLGLILAARMRPLPAAGLAAAMSLAWTGAAVAAVAHLSLLIDPLGPVFVAAGSFAIAALTRFAHDEWRARLLRASFEQHLAPDLVRRIAAGPGMLRLKGELREITALFTDIESFTSLTERADPAELVMLLDAYFDLAARVVIDHGGMVEKIVGDGVHAIFNAPFTLEDHPRHALACALALLDASELVRSSPLGQQLRLGRTRIGIETGPAIVGDVGGSRKLDYTAHGNAINTAARLEAANKELGSSICVGPCAASRLDPAALRRIGRLTLRGQSQPIDVFTPVAADHSGRARWHAAL